MSKESRFIGYLVLGFGVVAVLAVLILAFSGGGDPEERAADPKVAQELVADMAPPVTSNTPKASVPVLQIQPLPEAKPVLPVAPPKELYFKRDPDLSASDMEGTWQAAIGRYTAVLQMQRGAYQITYGQANPQAARLYSLGTYKVTEDMVELSPRFDWPAPASRSGAGYEILTRSPFPVIAAMQGGRMLWQNPPQSEDRVVAPYKTPAIAGENVNYIVWQKLK